MTSGGVRWACMIAGLLCVGLAALGVALPVLPTTPFLLVAAACFAKSSTRLHDWIYGNRWFGPYLQRYASDRAITPRDRVLSLALLWGGLGASAMWATDLWWVRALLVAIGVGVTVHLTMLKTWRGE